MPSSYIKTTSKILDKILAEKKGRVTKEEDIFVRHFYNHVPEKDIAIIEHNTLWAIASSALEFIKQKKSKKSKVRIFKPNKKDNGWNSDNTIIETNTRDMPFLLDSVTEVLKRNNLTIARVIHPILSVTRTREGEVESIEPHNIQGQVTDVESLIHFEVKETLTASESAKLEKDIKRVLKTVRAAVEDWPKMLKKMGEVLIEMSTVQPAIEKNFPDQSRKFISTYLSEVKDFLQWLIDNNFTFLGYVKYDFVNQSSSSNFDAVPKNELGILRVDDPKTKKGLQALPKDLLRFAKNPNLIEITKANRKSMVHRPVYMDYIDIKRFNENGEVIGEHRFLGLFTSIVYYQSAKLIPIIRQKISAVLKRSHFSHGSYNRKELTSALEAFPRDELFQLTEEELYETAMEIVTLSSRPRVKLFVRKDVFERYISAILYVPREKYSTKLRSKIQGVLEHAFNGTAVNHYTQITDSALARLTLIIKTEPGEIPAFDVNEIEREISYISKMWEETLNSELNKRVPSLAGVLYKKYNKAFTVDYAEKFSAYHTYWDILALEETIKNNRIKFDLYETVDEKDLFNLKIYNIEKKLTLSDIMPILENMGLDVIDEHTYLASPQDEDQKNIWIHHFRLAIANGQTRPNLFDIKENFEITVEKAWHGEIQNDGFNALTLEVGISWRDIVLIRAYSKYLHQIGLPFSRVYIEEVLATHPKLTKAIIKLFECKFSTSIKGDRASCQSELMKTIEKLLYSVSNLSEDKVLRNFVELVGATLRTNFYQKDQDGNHKQYISFKFRSKDVPSIPLPVPYKEIFVYSSRVEGIHLRGGKVARGGLRWSDRREDFRTEVLGLVKAQMTKNTVIVPVGSKGGFVVKNPPTEGGREAFLKEGIECYKTFLRGLLDITDNIIDGKIVPPKDVIRHDDDDPYLVVAADKGTATFSDIANDISKEYSFWLGDAFASGGSAGYDHKKMGITAKGAWVSVQRHFKEMGINTQTTDFTAVGIGDMAGDVFGNGMLLSKHIKLIAAFNHMHIFLDPNPVASESYKERKRLFNLSRSTWEDYNPKYISKGGGVFNRKDKSIKLSAEIRKVLGIKDASLAPDDLIKAILKSPVDLLWNGGIGTYVKAANETNEQVGDKTNDSLRVTGKELQCKVVGEGGNLGLTQLGRVEYAANGGRINTDFIDNSAGVDCSDHEVNIKILLGQAIENKNLVDGKRNALLEVMTDEVSNLCLRDNKLQAQALSIAERQGNNLLIRQQRFMLRLEKEKRLDREIEFLPNDNQIMVRNVEKRGLTRPELAVLLSYSKLSIYDNIIESNLPDEKYFKDDLTLYFPERLRAKYKKEISSHRLKREIIATAITNSIVNRMGCTFFHSVIEDTGLKGCDIARAYVATRDAFGIREIWREVEELGDEVTSETQLDLFIDIQNFIDRSVFWFLRNHSHPLDIASIVDGYEEGIKTVSKYLDKILSPVARKNYQDRLEGYISKNVPEPLSKKIASLEGLGSACDIIKVSKGAKNLQVERVGEIYFEVGARLQLGVLRHYIANLTRESFWDRLSIKTLTENLYDQQMRLTAEVIKNQCTDALCKTSVANWAEENAKEIARYDEFFNDLKASDHFDLATLVIAVKRVESICIL